MAEPQHPDPETWMVDYEHGDEEPQHAVLSWLDDEAKDLPEVGTQLVRKTDYDALEHGPASYEGIQRMLNEVQKERDDLRLRARKAEEKLTAPQHPDPVREALAELMVEAQRLADQTLRGSDSTDGPLLATLDAIQKGRAALSNPPPERAVRVWIDRQHYDFNKRIVTGARLRQAAAIPEDFDLWYEARVPDREDVRVPEDQGFALLQDARFYSSPRKITTGDGARVEQVGADEREFQIRWSPGIGWEVVGEQVRGWLRVVPAKPSLEDGERDG